jgi:hypothetical protein
VIDGRLYSADSEGAPGADSLRSSGGTGAGRTAEFRSPAVALTVRVTSDIEELRSLERQHNALFASCAVPHIGTAFPYIVADAATGSASDPWRLYTVYRNGELAGCLYGRRREGTTMRIRTPVFQLGPHYVADPLLQPVQQELILRRLIEALQEDQRDCAMFVFPRLSTSSFELLEHCAGESGLPWQWRWARYAYRFDTNLAPDEFLAGLDGEQRRELTRRERRLAQDHGCEYVREQGLGAEADMDRFETFMALEDSGWKGQNESSIRRRPGYEPYFRELVASASRGGLLIWYTLRSADRPIAMYLALRSHDTVWLPKIGYDENFASYGPGKMLTHHVMTDCLADPAIRHIDNISAAAWVELWKPVQSPFKSLTLFGRSSRSRLLHGGLAARDFARRLIGRQDNAPGPGDHPFL